MRVQRLQVTRVDLPNEAYDSEFWMSFVAPIPTFCLKATPEGKRPRTAHDAEPISGKNSSLFDEAHAGLDDTWERYDGNFPTSERFPVEDALDLL